MKGYARYFGKKMVWFGIPFIAAFLLNFILPRLMRGDPVAVIVARMAQGQSNAAGVEAIYRQYTELFGTNKPMLEQFIIYIKNVVNGDFGFSFSQYPRTVASVLKNSIGWTVILKLPAIIVGWIIGNLLGALAAYRRGGYDKATPVYRRSPHAWPSFFRHDQESIAVLSRHSFSQSYLQEVTTGESRGGLMCTDRN